MGLNGVFGRVACGAAVFGLAFRADCGWIEEMQEHPVELRRGLSVRRVSSREPREMTAYIARIDLATPGIGFVQTGRADRWGEPIEEVKGRPLKIETECETTVGFMERLRGEGRNVEVAVNTSPWAAYPPPKGCPYADVNGWCVTDGEEVSPSGVRRGVFAVRKDGTAEIGSSDVLSRSGDILFATCGFGLIMTNGVAVGDYYNPSNRHPRTAFGLTPDRKTLVLAVVDGRQPGYSMGADMDDLRALLRREGVADAVNMDGGGSSALVVRDPLSDRPLMLNRHARGRRRAVAVNFGVTFPEEEVREIERTGSVYQSYEFKKIEDTPPPEGFKPFYISHYGRHGSRMLTRMPYPDAIKTLESNPLTAEGERLLAAVRPVAEAQNRMTGELSLRGAEEHRRLARRMAERFRGVFAEGRRVRCTSSVKSRVLASMQNFTASLSESAPGLAFDFATGERFHRRLVPGAWEKEESEFRRQRSAAARFWKKSFDAAPFAKRFFAAEGGIDDPVSFARSLFQYASVCQCLQRELGGADIYGFFSPEETGAMYRCLAAEHYSGMGRSVEFGEKATEPSATLAREIAARADEAVADDRIAADLRFGHDSGLWPLAGFLGLEGPGDTVPFAEAAEKCPPWKWMSMGSNFQMVFYRDRNRETLVKILWNEREMRLKGLEPCPPPYYRWRDVRERLSSGWRRAARQTATSAPARKVL